MSILDHIREYAEMGWTLTPIRSSSKAAYLDGWSRMQETPTAHWESYPEDGVGILHAFSGTCAIDIDDLENTREKLSMFGIDIDTLLAEGVRIDSGRPNKAKLLYALSSPMRTIVLKAPGGTSDVEFRCASAGGSMMDVLPPSIHPDTEKPYTWIGDYTKLPPLPYDLQRFWEGLQKKTAPSNREDGEGPIQAFNEWVSNENQLSSLLEGAGYKPSGRGLKWLYPLSTTGKAGVVALSTDLIFSHHAGDPLSGLHDAFDLYRILYMDGDYNKTAHAVTQMEGVRAILDKGKEVDLQPFKEKLNTPKPVVPKAALPFDVPEGPIGDLTRYIIEASPRPIPEAAFLGALTFFAGLAGRAYNVIGLGLNIYTVLLAPAGTGKEGVNHALTEVINQVREGVPSADFFLGPNDFTSEKALLKRIMKYPSFYSVFGEVGFLFQSLKRSDSFIKTLLQKQYLDLYGKSNARGRFHGIEYANADNDVQPISSPAFSFFGESTASSFFEGIDASDIESGLVPRLLFLSTQAVRPPMNWDHHSARPSEALIEKITQVAEQAITANSRGPAFPPNVIELEVSDAVQQYLRTINEEFDVQIRGDTDPLEIAILKRSFVHCVKVAGLIAVARDPQMPSLQIADLEYAQKFVTTMNHSMFCRLDGDDFADDSAQRVRTVEEWLREVPSTKSRRVTAKMIEYRVLPYAYLCTRASRSAVFRKSAYRGTTEALKATLSDMADQGRVEVIQKTQMLNNFNVNTMGYKLFVGEDEAE